MFATFENISKKVVFSSKIVKSTTRWIKKWGSLIEIVDAPHSPNGAKKARKKTFFSWMGSLCVRLPHRFQQTWCHPSENPAVATKNSNTHLKDENIEKYCETATIQNTKILITGSPRAHFEHLGVQPGSKLHARHDGHSEIISL